MTTKKKAADIAGGAARPDVVVPEPAPPAAAPAVDEKAGGNVDQIRNILVGNQMRDYDRRFQRLEEALKKDIVDLRQELKTQLEALEQHHRSEFRDLRDAQARETRERLDALKELSESFKETSEQTHARIKALEADMDRRAAELRDQILDQSKALSEDVQARDDRISGELAQTASLLDHRKLDRNSLAQLLVEVAMRISDEHGDDPG